VFICGSVKTPRKNARCTRHAIALDSAKYTEPVIGFNTSGIPGERMNAVAVIATPMVALMHILDRHSLDGDHKAKTLTNNKLVHFVKGP